MRNNETGEFELVIGNKQLLAGFFIVVILFAVAFAMGYILGQNSPRSAKLQAESPGTVYPAAGDARPQPVSPSPPGTVQAGDAAPGGAGTPAGTAGAPADAAPQPTTQPAREPEPAPVPTVPVVAAAPAPAPEAAPGSYWQVMALGNQAEAEVVVRTLKDRGFPASMSLGRNNLTRVLVGPYTDTQTMGRAKTALENAGFHPVRK